MFQPSVHSIRTDLAGDQDSANQASDSGGKKVNAGQIVDLVASVGTWVAGALGKKKKGQSSSAPAQTLYLPPPPPPAPTTDWTKIGQYAVVGGVVIGSIALITIGFRGR